MAKDKKSFLLYCDTIHTVKKLSDEQAGNLFKHILSYVNDENPISDNIITELTFEPIKQYLKRDLQKFESKCLKNSENAKMRWDKLNANACERIKVNAKHADSDSDSDSDIKKETIICFNFKKSLIELEIDLNIIDDWMKVRRNKKASNTETSFNRIKKQIEISGKTANECIKIAVEKDWKGFEAEWLNNTTTKTTNNANRRNLSQLDHGSATKLADMQTT